MGQTVQTCPEPPQKCRSGNSCHACGLWEDGCAESPGHHTSSPVARGRRHAGTEESSVLLPKPSMRAGLGAGSVRDQLKNRPSADERWREAKEEWERQVARQIEEAELRRSAAAAAEAAEQAKEGGAGENNDRLSAMAMIKAEDEERRQAEAEDELRRSEAEAAAKARAPQDLARRPLDAIEEESVVAPTPRPSSPDPEGQPLPAGDADPLADAEPVQLSTRSRSAMPPEVVESEVLPGPEEGQS